MTKLCVLALLQSTVAFDLHQHPVVESVLGDLEEDWSEFRSLVTQHLQPNLFPLRSFVPNNTETCGSCSQDGTKFLMEHAMKQMQAKCANASAEACVFGKVCTWMSKHPKVAMGMMLEHLRPMSLMQAYCTGKGVCEKPDDMGMSEILSGSQPHEALLKNFDQIDWSKVIEEAGELMPPAVDEKAKEVSQEAPKCESNSQVCPYCMKKNIKRSTWRAIMKVKAMCQETKSPVMLKMCPWMHDNREVALGMLLSKVEPWKFSKGWCMHKAKHRGHHWRHHHGYYYGHRGHKHDGHHDHEHDDHGYYYHVHHGHPKGHWHQGHHEHGGWHHEHHHEHHAHGDQGFKGGVWGHVQQAQKQGEAMITV